MKSNYTRNIFSGLLIIFLILLNFMADCGGKRCPVKLYVQNDDNIPKYFCQYEYVNNKICIYAVSPLLTKGEKYLMVEMSRYIKKGLKKIKCENERKISGIPSFYFIVTDSLRINKDQCFENIDSLIKKSKAIRSYTITEIDFEYGTYTLMYP